jgi:hypothetical protein
VTILTDPEVMVVKISSPRVVEEGETVEEGEEPTTEVGAEAEASSDGDAEASEESSDN